MKKIQGLTPKKVENHIKLEELQYCKSVKKWLIERIRNDPLSRY